MLINHGNYPDHKTQICRDYIQALEEERRKIQVFRRELPLCLELVTQGSALKLPTPFVLGLFFGVLIIFVLFGTAIESYKQQLSGTTTEYNLNGQSECSEQTTSAGPVLEEFIPLKRAEEDEEEDYEEQSHKSNNDDNNDNEFNINISNSNNNSKKSDWLRSVQLWNQFPDPTPKEVISSFFFFFSNVLSNYQENKKNNSVHM